MRCSKPGCYSRRWGHAKTCFRHTPVSRRTLYRVWHTITANPRLSIRECAAATSVAPPTVQRALHHLRTVGAIVYEGARAWRIVEPFSWVDWP